MDGAGAIMAGSSAIKEEAMIRSTTNHSKSTLDTYIYDYFLRKGQRDIAKAMLDSDLKILTTTSKTIDRQEAKAIDDSTDADLKAEMQKRVEGLPAAALNETHPGEAFLMDWWLLFWDLWSATRPTHKGNNGPVSQYLAHTQTQSRILDQLSRQATMMPANINQYRNMIPNGMVNGMNGMTQVEMQRTAMANNLNVRNMYPQFQNSRNLQLQQQQMGQTQMQREGSETDLNGQPRAQSPMSGDSAPSPKRQRLDAGQFNGQQMGAGGRTQAGGPPMPNGATAAMLMQSGVDPNAMVGAQFPHLNGQAASTRAGVQIYAQSLAQNQKAAMNDSAIPKAMAGYAHDHEMMQAGPDVEMQISSGYLEGNMAGQGPRGMAGQPGQVSALADYQNQLMLLEKQNKQRLNMARHGPEVNQRDAVIRTNGSQGTAGQAPNYAAARMSPRGSRTGHSPGANDPSKRGTPNMGHNSPMPDGTGRGSPIPNSFDASPLQFFQPQPMAMNGHIRVPQAQQGFQGANGIINQQQQMEMFVRQQNAARMPNGNWAQGPMAAQMMPQGQLGPQPSADSSQARNPMPPPQAPSAGRVQPPPSPPQAGAISTPSQSNKPNPKPRKDSEKPPKKQKNQKKQQAPTAAVGATPSSEVEQPPTPTPPTPITPVGPLPFSNGSKPPASQIVNAQTQIPAGMPQVQLGIAMHDNGGNGTFGFGMDFDELNTGDVLDGFDFDALINTEQDGAVGFPDFDPTFPFDGNGVELGTGEP